MITAQDRSQISTIREPSSCSFCADVLRGLRAHPKHLPSKYFYDETGLELFERITELGEYYPTRTELAIMRQIARDGQFAGQPLPAY